MTRLLTNLIKIIMIMLFVHMLVVLVYSLILSCYNLISFVILFPITISLCHYTTSPSLSLPPSYSFIAKQDFIKDILISGSV